MASAAINNHAGCGNDSAMSANDIDRLLDPAASRHDIFGNHETLARFNFESAAQGQTVSFFLDKDMAFA